jgi:hypothetical protein
MTDKKSNIPEFTSYEEEAKFWDTHSFTEFFEETKPVNIRFVRPKTQGITVRFDEQTLNNLRQVADQKGIGPTSLIRMWVKERLSNPPFAG